MGPGWGATQIHTAGRKLYLQICNKC